MSNESSTLFKPVVSNQPLTVLLLIENSLKIYSVWRDLREYYLNSLIDTILRANDRALTSLAVIESSVDASGTRRPPRQIPLTPSALQSVEFDFASDGRISPSRVNDCIQHLDESIYSFDGSPTVHLVIVAASAPSDDCTGLTSPTSGNAPWGLLAEKLSQRNIHCHLIMVSGEDVTPLTMLFEQTLYLQNNVEEPPPFRIDQRQYIFRLSARPLYPELGELEQNASTYAAVSGVNARRNSHLDSHFDGNLPPPSSVTAFPPQNEISLVSHLKLAQGLIKKKQHSKDPQPAPFIADVRVQDPTSQPYPIIPSSSPTSSSPSSSSSSSSSSTLASTPPTSASTSLSSIPLTSRHRKPQSLAMAGYQTAPQDTLISPTNGGRAMSHSKADRMHRVSQASAGSSPTESVHTHMRRSSQPQIQGAGVGGGQGGSPGSWFTSNSNGLSQMQQGHIQRGSRVSTPDLDIAMSSPGMGGGSGPGSANGMVIGTSSGVGRRGATLDGAIGGVNAVTSEAAPPSIGGTGNHDISPGSVSSYVSSDMSSPTTPGSTEDLFSYARTHGLHHQAISYQIPYQPNGVVAGSQDCLWAQGPQHQQSQMQEMQLLQHQENLQPFHQTAAVQQSHFYPGAYDPASNYFPAQTTVPTQQYYLPQQSGPTQHQLNESVYQPGMSGGPTAEQIQDVQTQQSSIPRQAMRQPRQPYNSYFHTRPAMTASPPPMIVPSQSHVPLTAVNQATGAGSATHPTMEVGVAPRSSPPRPTTTRTATGQQGQGRARASTVTTPSNLKNSSSSKIAKSKRHKKSASSVSHSAFLQSTIDPQVSSSAAAPASAGDEIFEVPPLYAASTGVLFESMFNIKSGLLDGPAALANPEDVALVAPALGFGEGPNVLATYSSDDVEAAGGLFRSRLKERGGVVDEVTGTTLVSVPSATVGTLHGDSPSTVSSTGVGPSAQPIITKGDMSAIQSFVDAATTTSMSRPSYPLSSANMIPSVAYPYEGQQVPYGTLNGRLNCQ